MVLLVLQRITNPPLSDSRLCPARTTTASFVALYQHAHARLRGANARAALYIREDAVLADEL